ncbi:MAG: chloride channel protein [Aggregatilineales bacterium]|nr:chloride channel protein [Aggregatilineales bacterium]HPV05819.1 chloride channel protein [Aggregatilineales bacterium]
MYRLALHISGLLNRVQPSGEVVALGTGLLVGLATGLAAVVFNLLIEFISGVSYGAAPRLGGGSHWYVLAMPAIGGLLVGPLTWFFAREARGHGVPEVMQAIALQGGRIRPIVAVLKAITASITIGTGGSAGREGPIIQIGSAIGSTVGQLFNLSDNRIRGLVASGAAGGIAATFNAPMAGVIFGLEVILGELNVGHVSAIVVSAVTSNAVMKAILGGEYIFGVKQPYTLVSAWEFILYAVLGVVAAWIAWAFVRSLVWMEDLFERQKAIPGWVQPAIGGLLLGILGLLIPRLFPFLSYDVMPDIYGGGYEPIMQALGGEMLLLPAFVLIWLKILATDLTLGSGGSGGVFAPSLFMGAMTGAAFGQVVNAFFPGIAAPPGAYALVGMGAVFAGSAHAPITAVVMLFELTGDYRIILPLMLTIIIALIVGRSLLGNESIYTLKLARRGIRLRRGRDVDVLESVPIEDVMVRDVETVPPTMTLVELSETFSHNRYHGFPVVDASGELWGMVTITDLERAVAEDRPRRTLVSEIGTPLSRLPVAYPDESMGAALTRMGTRGLAHLPVVSRENPRHLVGLVRHIDAVRAYNLALARRSELAHRQKRMQLQHAEGTEFVEIRLKEGDAAVGRRVRDAVAKMPFDFVLVSVQRNGTTLIPHGDTRLQAGDLITAFVRTDAIDDLNACLRSAPEPEGNGVAHR